MGASSVPREDRAWRAAHPEGQGPRPPPVPGPLVREPEPQVPHGPRAPALPTAGATAPRGPQHLADRPSAHMRLPAAKRDCPPHTCPLPTGAGGASQESEAWQGRGHVPGMRAGLPRLQRPDPRGSQASGRPCLCPHHPAPRRAAAPASSALGHSSSEQPRACGFPLPGSERRPGKQSVLSPNHDVVPKKSDCQHMTGPLTTPNYQAPPSASCHLTSRTTLPLPLFSTRLQKTLPLQDC